MNLHAQDIWPKYIRSDGIYTIFSGHKCPLSNLYIEPFAIGDNIFTSVEQFYAASKAFYFYDHRTASIILQTTDSYQIKRLSRQVSNFDAELWNTVKNDVMYQALIAKFDQSEIARTVLENTKDTILLAGSSNLYWDIGVRTKYQWIPSSRDIRGQNTLGRMLQTIRQRYC